MQLMWDILQVTGKDCQGSCWSKYKELLDDCGKRIAEVNDAFKLLPQQLNCQQFCSWNSNTALRFLCETLSRLLKLTLQKTLFCGWLIKYIQINPYIQIKKLYDYKIVRAAKQS